MSDTFGISVPIGGDDSGFQSTFARVESSLEEWGFSFDKLYGKADEFFKGFGVDIDQFASKLGTTGPELAAGLGVALIAFEAVKKVVE